MVWSKRQLYYVADHDFKKESFTWEDKASKAKGLKPFALVLAMHPFAAPGVFRPTVDDVYLAITDEDMLNRAEAFAISLPLVGMGEEHWSEVTLYEKGKGDVEIESPEYSIRVSVPIRLNPKIVNPKSLLKEPSLEVLQEFVNEGMMSRELEEAIGTIKHLAPRGWRFSWDNQYADVNTHMLVGSIQAPLQELGDAYLSSNDPVFGAIGRSSSAKLEGKWVSMRPCGEWNDFPLPKNSYILSKQIKDSVQGLGLA